MSTSIISAKVSTVKFGDFFCFEGLKLEDEQLKLQKKEFAITVQQTASLFQVSHSHASRDLKAILGKDYKFKKAKINNCSHKYRKLVNYLNLEELKIVADILAFKGNSTALAMLNLEPHVKQQLEKVKNNKKAASNSVYVIGDIERNVCKIGITNNLQQRLSTIQTAYPYELSVWFTKAIRKPKTLETSLHNSLADYRLKGEWFEGDVYHLVDWSSI